MSRIIRRWGSRGGTKSPTANCLCDVEMTNTPETDGPVDSCRCRKRTPKILVPSRDTSAVCWCGDPDQSNCCDYDPMPNQQPNYAQSQPQDYYGPPRQMNNDPMPNQQPNYAQSQPQDYYGPPRQMNNDPMQNQQPNYMQSQPQDYYGPPRQMNAPGSPPYSMAPNERQMPGGYGYGSLPYSSSNERQLTGGANNNKFFDFNFDGNLHVLCIAGAVTLVLLIILRKMFTMFKGRRRRRRRRSRSFNPCFCRSR